MDLYCFFNILCALCFFHSYLLGKVCAFFYFHRCVFFEEEAQVRKLRALR